MGAINVADDILQVFREGRVDAKTLSDFMSKKASETIDRRLAPSIRPFQYYLDYWDTVPTIVNDAINNTAVEGGVLADTFVTATANGVDTIARTQRDVNSDTKSIKDFIDAKLANDFAASVGGKVFIPNGNYTTAADLDMTNFWGSGVITNTVNNKVFSRPDSEYVMPEFYGITDADASSGMHSALDKGYVRLKSGRTYKVNGTYSINKDIVIDGNNATLLGSDNVVMQVFADCTITIRNLNGSGFKNLIKNTGNFKVKLDFQGCDFTEVKKLVDFGSVGSLAFYLKGNKFSKMFSAIWAICAIKGSLAEYNEFTEMANIATDPLAEHMNVFKLANGTTLHNSGLVVFRHNTFSDISGGMPSGSGYVVPIFAAVKQLICDGNVFENIRGSDDAVEHRSRAIYSYGFNDKIINNTFINAGRYEIVTLKGDITATSMPSIVSGNSFHQDFPLTNGGLTVETAFNVDISKNVWTGNYARVRVGSSGYQFGTVNFSGNNFNTVNAIKMDFTNTRILNIHSNTLYRADRASSPDDNILSIGSDNGHVINVISIKGNTVTTPNTRPTSGTSPRRFITITNESIIDKAVIRGNELLGGSPDWLPHSLLIEDAKDMHVIWSDNIVDNAMLPDITGGTFTSYNNIYDGILETSVPTP